MKPYLIRAVREWAMDNGFTPQVLVDANCSNVNVPIQYVSEGRIVLNIHDQAVQGLEISNEWILFNARFSGTVHQVDVPMDAVLSLFSAETRQGITFAETGYSDAVEHLDQDEPAVEAEQVPRGKPQLRIVR